MTERVVRKKDAGICVFDDDILSFDDDVDTLPLAISPDRNSVAIAAVKYGVVFSDSIGYTFRIQLRKAVFRYWHQVFFLDGKHLCRYLFCYAMFLGITCSGQPCKAILIKRIDVLKYTMFCKIILRIFDDSFDPSLRLRIGSATKEHIESYRIQIILKSLCINDVSMILTDRQHLILIVYQFTRSAAKVFEGFDMRLDK